MFSLKAEGARLPRKLPGCRKSGASVCASCVDAGAGALPSPARGWLCVVFAALLAACSPQAPERPVFHDSGLPERLSEWNVFRVHHGVLELNGAATPYDLATPLFSDYAQKLRTITIPEGGSAGYSADGDFDLPIGTIFSKTFYYPKTASGVAAAPDRTAIDGVLPLGGLRLIETRILARRAEGWIALAYVWNAEQTEATLERTGASIPLTLERADGRREDFAYFVPNALQCAGCHATDAATRQIRPIGVKARHLNKPSSFVAANQLDHWRLMGLLTGDVAPGSPANASWTDEQAPLADRARAYLDANCSHCHSDIGPADTSGLDLRPAIAMGPKVGLCKATIAAGSGSGGRPYDIVPGDPDQSILVWRMETNEPAAMMPELGRSVTHEEGVALIRQWIAGMAGGCS
jgi:uncharacterized repeat protein (TIGR03806 family)